jgi:hypothetical protein
MIGEGRRPPRLDDDLVTVGELAHVQLAGGGAFWGPCAWPLIMSEHVPQMPSRQSWSNTMGSLPVVDQPLVDVVEHLEERGVVGHLGGVRRRSAGALGAVLAPDLEGEVEHFGHRGVTCSSSVHLLVASAGRAFSKTSGSLFSTVSWAMFGPPYSQAATYCEVDVVALGLALVGLVLGPEVAAAAPQRDRVRRGT